MDALFGRVMARDLRLGQTVNREEQIKDSGKLVDGDKARFLDPETVDRNPPLKQLEI